MKVKEWIDFNESIIETKYLRINVFKYGSFSEENVVLRARLPLVYASYFFGDYEIKKFSTSTISLGGSNHSEFNISIWVPDLDKKIVEEPIEPKKMDIELKPKIIGYRCK